jgi:hypothetical protein
VSRVVPAGAMTIVALILWLAAAPQVQAHNRSQSYSTWNLSTGAAEVMFTVKAREVTRLPPLEGGLLTLEGLLTAHLRETVRVTAADGADCVPRGEPRALAAAEGYLRVRASFDCDNGPPSTLQLDSFFAIAPSHVHYARVLTDGRHLPGEYLFTDGRREYAIAPAAGSADSIFSGFLQYLALGVEHILGGVDHLAFLAALLLLVRNFRELFWIVTGFTVGHTITLSLAVLGYLALELWVIEALIGFTIALVAADNIGVVTGRRGLIAAITVGVLLVMVPVSLVWGVGLPVLTLAGLALFTVAYMAFPADQPQARGLRPALTLAFGLVHGFGFANVLGEMGLPEERLAVALAGFNIGVELGQLAVVALLWGLIHWCSRLSSDRNYQNWLDTASACLCGLGVFWFVSRGFVQV